MYGLALIVPIIVLLLSCWCMLTKKVCCSCYSICYCPICQIVSAIFGILMLMISFFSSAFIVPLTTALGGDMNAMQDEILSFLSTNGYVQTETVSLPIVSFLTFEEQTINIPMTSTADIYNAVRVNGEIGDLSTILSGIIPDMSAYDATAAMALPILGVSSLSEIIDNIITNINADMPKNVTINLNGTDFGRIFDVTTSRGLLNMLKNNGGSITDYLTTNLNAIFPVFLNDHFSLLYDALNFSTIASNVASFDIASIFSMFGFDFSSLLGPIAETVSGALQTAYCAIDAMPSQTTASSDYITFTWDITDAFITSSASISAPSISSPTIGVLESLYVNIWLEYLYSKGLAPASITDNTNQTQVENFIKNNLIVSGLNTQADINQFVLGLGTDGTDIATFIADIYSVTSTQISDFNTMASGTPDRTKLITIPDWFALSLYTRTTTGTGTVPTAPTTNSGAVYAAYFAMDA